MIRWRIYINNIFHGSVMAETTEEALQKAKKRFVFSLLDEVRAERSPYVHS